MRIIEHVIAGRRLRAEKQLDSYDLLEYYPKIQGFRFNFVTQAGEPLDIDSGLLTSETDRAILKTIRSVSDLIITSGRTAEQENLSGSKFAPLLVLTQRNEIHARLTTELSRQKVFITTDVTNFDNQNCVGVGRTTEPIAQWVLEFCRSFSSVTCETGLTLGKELRSLFTEIDITVTKASSKEEAELAIARVLSALDTRAEIYQLIQIDADFFFRLKPNPRNP